MSRESPSMDELYGVGAEQADAEAQDDIVFDLQEGIASRAGYSHNYWRELAERAVSEIERLRAARNSGVRHDRG